MKLHLCKTCKEERFENHFKYTYKDGVSNVLTKKCKVCRGTRITNREDENYEVNFGTLMLVLTRLHFNEGKATANDCIGIMETYKDLYGENMPYFTNNKDRLVYQWERLKGFWNRNKEFKF